LPAIGGHSGIWIATLVIVTVFSAAYAVLSQIVAPALRRRPQQSENRTEPYATVYCRWSDDEVRQFQAANLAVVDPPAAPTGEEAAPEPPAAEEASTAESAQAAQAQMA